MTVNLRKPEQQGSCADTKIALMGRSYMEFLRKALKEHYETMCECILVYNEGICDKSKKMKLVDLSEGAYVSKEKFHRIKSKNQQLEMDLKRMYQAIKHLVMENNELHQKIQSEERALQDIRRENIYLKKYEDVKSQLYDKGIKNPEIMIMECGGIEAFEFDDRNHARNINEILRSDQQKTKQPKKEKWKEGDRNVGRNRAGNKG